MFAKRRCVQKGAVAFAVLCTALGASAATASALNVEVVNDSGQPSGDVYLMLSGGSSSDGQLPDDTSEPLSQLKDSTFSIESISAGRVYVSYGAPVADDEPPLATTRYDKIELTDPGVANLTAVDFFAIPFQLQALDATGAPVGGELGYHCYTSTILPRLRAIAPAAEVTSGGQFVRFLSPQLSPSSYPSMEPYVQSMVGQTIEVNDSFASKTEPYRQISYSGTFEADGSITLTGTTTTPPSTTPVPGYTVKIEGATLPSAIYTGNEPFEVNGKQADVSENNEYSVIYRDIVAGFALGYWGGRYGNSTTDWLGQPDFAAARSESEPYATYDQYAAAIGEYSDAYGYSFNDLGPTPVTVPLEASVATLRLTIDPDQGPSTPGCLGESLTSPLPSTTPTSGGSAGKAKSGGPAQGKPTIRSGAATLDKRGRAPLTLSCAGGPCQGVLTLDYTYKVHQRPPRGRRGKGRTIERTVVLGRAAFSIAAGKSKLVLVPIGAAGRNRIANATRRRLNVLVEVTVGPQAKQPTIATRRQLTLKSYTPPPRRRGR